MNLISQTQNGESFNILVAVPLMNKLIRRERSPGKRSTKLTRRMEAVRSIQEGSKTPSRQQDRDKI